MQHFLDRLLLLRAETLDLNYRLGRRFLEDMLAVKRCHSLVLFRFLLRLGLGAQLLLACGLRDARIIEIALLASRNRFGIEDQAVRLAVQRDALAAGEDLMMPARAAYNRLKVVVRCSGV